MPENQKGNFMNTAFSKAIAALDEASEKLRKFREEDEFKRPEAGRLEEKEERVLTTILDLNANDEFMIGDEVKITILERNRGQKIRIGIDAPRDILVHREEIFEELQQEAASSK